MIVRTFTLLLSLVACVTGLPGMSGGPGGTSVAHAKENRAVGRITDKLDKVERKIAEEDFQFLSMEAWSVYEDFRDADDDLKSDPAFPKLTKRWRELTAKAAELAGGHAKEILGDGKVPPGDDKEREELFESVEHPCRMAAQTSNNSRALKELKENYAKYEKALARAMKVDPTSVRHKNGHFKLFACELAVTQLQMDFEDNATMEDMKTEAYKTCGYDKWVLRRLKLGSKWGPWEVDGVPGSNGYPLDCKKHPKASKISGNMAALFREEFKYPGNAVWTVSGSATTARVGLDIYQYQEVRVFGKDITMTTSACGDKDKKVVCEASGAGLVREYNAAAHISARAEVHRGAGRAERCKNLYKKVSRDVKNVMAHYENDSKHGDWDKTLKYKTRNDGIMNETKLVARLTEMGEQADERSVGKYCQNQK